ncbi:hypothetical protein [Labrenzia sp. DG1229]|uniref:hypothetical protein n=1 Tax=Labrenzia sp. DG1229 TaxID=681847 RepID=UPI000A006AD3
MSARENWSEEFQGLLSCPIVAVLNIESVEQATPLARSLVLAGLTSMEITLRTDADPAVVREIKRRARRAVKLGSEIST